MHAKQVDSEYRKLIANIEYKGSLKGSRDNLFIRNYQIRITRQISRQNTGLTFLLVQS